MFRVVAILVIFVTLLGVAIWNRLEIRNARINAPVGHVQLGWDTSSSYPRDCAQIVDRVVKSAIAAVPVGKASTFSFIVTGGGATSSHEPRLVLSGTSIPREQQGTLMRVRRSGTERDQFLSHVRETCESLPTEPTSSLFRTLEVGLAHMREGCPVAGLCIFAIGTDMRETVNRDVADYLRGAKKSTRAPKLDPGFVRVIICGYADSAGGGAPVEAGDQFLARVRSLFTREVELRPYCDGAINPTKA